MNEDDYVRNIGNNIRRIRKEKGITQVVLADLLNTEDSAIRRLESGRINPTIKNLLRIAQALNIQVEDLLVQHNPYICPDEETEVKTKDNRGTYKRV